MVHVRRIQTKIAFWTGLCLLLAATVITWYSATTLRAEAINSATRQAIAEAHERASAINEEIEVGLNSARTLAHIFMSVKDSTHTLSLTREQVDVILQSTLEDNPHFVAVYTAWQPNSFDGKDNAFVGKPTYDKKGQFLRYWSRNTSGDIAVEPLVLNDIAQEDPHMCATRTRLECISDPHTYPVQGNTLKVISMVVPVIVDGDYFGVVGIDIGLDFFQTIANSVTMYDGTATMSLITYNGIIASASNHPEFIGSYATLLHPDFDTDNELQRLQQGEGVAEFMGHELEIFVPIFFMRTWAPWSVNVIVPEEKITLEATHLMWLLIGIGSGLTLLGLGIVWVVAGKIARPIQHITGVARAVTDGKLDVQATVATHDEVGILATAFNTMVTQLREQLNTVRQARDTAEQQYQEQARLLNLVATLETPIIEIMDGIIYAPIVGSLDSYRASMLTERLLHEVHTHTTRKVILDITGVVDIDTQVAHALIQMAQAVHLLGSDIVVTGISPVVATTITYLGIDLERVMRSQSLQDVLLEHQQQMMSQ